MTRPATDINKIASEMYHKLTDEGEANIDEVRLAFFDIMNTSADINASYGVPDPTVATGRRITTPFVPIGFVPAEDPIAAINFKVETGAAASLTPQIIRSDDDIVGAVTPLNEIAAPQESSLIAAPTHEEVIIPQPEIVGKWTNLTLRVELGKHGFLEDPVRKRIKSDDTKEYRTYYIRRGYEVILVENDTEAPYLLSNLGQLIDVTQIAYRNVNMRQPTEGGQA